MTLEELEAVQLAINSGGFYRFNLVGYKVVKTATNVFVVIVTKGGKERSLGIVYVDHLHIITGHKRAK